MAGFEYIRLDTDQIMGKGPNGPEGLLWGGSPSVRLVICRAVKSPNAAFRPRFCWANDRLGR
jgi:hypothetical protein